MKKSNFKPMAAALGTTFAISLAVSPVANAADNPFGMTELSKSGYMTAAGHGEGGLSLLEARCGSYPGPVPRPKPVPKPMPL